MINDMFVSKSVKDIFETKPMTPKQFIKYYEKLNNIKIYRNIRKAFLYLYKNSYESIADVVNIRGSRGSGKTTLSLMIAEYDCLRSLCIKHHMSKTKVCFISDQNFVFNCYCFKRDVSNMSELTDKVDAFVATNEKNLLGIRPIIYVDDNLSYSSIVSNAYNDFRLLLKSNSNPVRHFISTFYSVSSKKSLDLDERNLTINLG